MEGTLSPADVAVLSGSNRNNDGFGGNSAWWIVLFLIFGWGNRGFGGGYGNGGTSVYEGYVLNNDMSQLSKQISDSTNMLERRTDNIISGLCDGFYTNAQLINNTNTNILTQGNGINTNILTGVNTLQGAIKDCCCTTQRSIDSVNFNNAQNTCAITNAITLSSRDIIDNQNANYRALHDEIVANRIEDKNAQIAAQQNEINALRLAASQEKQNNYLVEKLQFPKCPSPAYVVPNPYCNCNNGCGCNM